MAKRGRPKSKGLGDTIAKVTKATGIDKVVKAVGGDDCGCAERQEKLNKLFPYYKDKLSLTDAQRSIYARIRGHLYKDPVRRDAIEALRLLHNDVFKRNLKPSSCGSCIRKWRDEFEKVYQNQCDED